MSRALTYALALPLLAAECLAQFVAHDPRWTAVFAVLTLGVVAVRLVLGPDGTGCLPDCPECAESESLDTTYTQRGK